MDRHGRQQLHRYRLMAQLEEESTSHGGEEK